MSARLCLLVVDDDPDLLAPVIEVCERYAFKAIGAASAQKAFQTLEHCHVDAILTDIRMQPMSGFEMLEKIRATQPELPFILWTGFWDRPDEMRAATYPNIEKLEKPFTFIELEKALNRVREKIFAKRANEPEACQASSSDQILVTAAITSELRPGLRR